MHTLIKVLSTLMLMGLFSTNAMAWVDCSRLPGYIGYGKVDIKSECEKFQFLYGNTGMDWHSKDGRYTRKAGVDYRNGGNSSANSYQAPAKKVVKKTMSMDEIHAYKFDKALNGYRTTEKDLIAKTLIEKYDLWAVYKKAGGDGIRYVLKKKGLEYAGGEITDYSRNIHTGNFFVYIFTNYSIKNIKKKLDIKFSDFSEMGIDPDDFFEGKVSKKKFFFAYGVMSRERLKKKLGVKVLKMSSLF